MMKIFSDDTNLPYRSTTLKAIDSKRDIDAILARYGIIKVMWTWDLPKNDVELVFQFSEEFQDMKVTPVVRMKPPTIWHKHRRGKADEIDWKLSMRIFMWFIKNSLAMTYAMQSEKTIAFLPFIVVSKEETLKDVVIPRLDELKHFKALPEKDDNVEVDESKVIDVQLEEPKEGS